MKSSKLLTLGILSAGLMLSSCSDDDGEDMVTGPSLNLTELNHGVVDGEVTITSDETVSFRWRADAGDNQLEEFSLQQNGNNTQEPAPVTLQGIQLPYDDIDNDDDETYIDTLEFSNFNNIGTTSYTFIVTDGMVSESVTIDVIVEEDEVLLQDPQDLTWERLAGVPVATGLTEFGLEWDLNSDSDGDGEAEAVIELAMNGAEKMVSFSSAAAYTDIENESQLAEAIDDGDPVVSYTEIAAGVDQSINEVIAVRFDGTDYLINLLNVEASTSMAGTSTTITGEYKSSN
ncbi:MAG: hypothetical protein GVX78_02460 [Bacteroidetes bacterium]|jgi:hypothetical protein|nr:hypothetical protein [Bacteroidota bacterium]